MNISCSLTEGDDENWKLSGVPSLETWCLFYPVTYSVSAKLFYIIFLPPPIFVSLKKWRLMPFSSFIYLIICLDNTGQWECQNSFKYWSLQVDLKICSLERIQTFLLMALIHWCILMENWFFFFPLWRSHLHIKNGKLYFKERFANKMKAISLMYALDFRIGYNFH